MDCPTCGHPNPSEARFCGSCATPLTAASPCPSCGASNPAGQKFCNACGQELAAPAGEAAPAIGGPAARPTSRSHVPEHLAEKIRAGRGALEGERKQVTVLFADVMGSMELAERSDPEEWRQIMERFFAILCEGVHRFEGTVNKFTGDGIMALFGAPIAHEDHAQRACYAALHLQQELAAYAAELRREQGLSFSVRMGLNSGEVVVGAIGEDLAMDYTAIGHTVGLAQRMEQLAEPGKAYLTEHTASLVEGYLALTDLGEFQVKGASRPLRVHELTGVGAARGRLDVSRARGFSRFVGRDDELRMLESALEQALAGQRQVIGIVGEAGVGKSRLCHEFARALPGEGHPRLPHRRPGARQVHPAAAGAPDHALLLRRHRAGLRPDRARADRRQAAAARRELRRGPAADLRLPRRARSRAPVAAHGPRGAPAPAARRSPSAWSAPRAPASRASPCSRTCTGSTPRARRSSPTTSRPPRERAASRSSTSGPSTRPPWMSKSYYRQIALAPLGPEAIEEMLADLLGSDPSLDGLPDARSASAPPATRSSSRRSCSRWSRREASRASAAPTGSCDRSRRRRCRRACRRSSSARIDRLAEREKAVLQAAAVIGKEFPEPGACASRRAGAGGARGRASQPGGGRVRLRAGALSRGGLRVQAPAHPGGGLRLAARRAPVRRPRGGRAGDRRGAPGAARRVGRAAGPALGERRGDARGGALERARRRLDRDQRSDGVAAPLAEGARADRFPARLRGDGGARALGADLRRSATDFVSASRTRRRRRCSPRPSGWPRGHGTSGRGRSCSSPTAPSGPPSTGEIREAARLARQAIALAEESGDPALYMVVSSRVLCLLPDRRAPRGGGRSSTVRSSWRTAIPRSGPGSSTTARSPTASCRRAGTCAIWAGSRREAS